MRPEAANATLIQFGAGRVEISRLPGSKDLTSALMRHIDDNLATAPRTARVPCQASGGRQEPGSNRGRLWGAGGTERSGPFPESHDHIDPVDLVTFRRNGRFADHNIRRGNV
jgi:hypothetical protein